MGTSTEYDKLIRLLMSSTVSSLSERFPPRALSSMINLHVL